MSFKRLLIEKTPLGRLFRPFQIADVREVAPRFWELGLRCDFDHHSKPGDKLQILCGDGTRTYSPYAVERRALKLLCYAHDGESPGARLGPTAKVGDELRIMGPRDSLALVSFGDVVLVGDETSFGVARALHDLGSRSRLVFELNAAEPAQQALDHLGLTADVIQRQPDDRHLPSLVAALRTDATLVLTGKATTIVALRRELKGTRQKNKAYWAPGKRGLD